MHFNCYIFYLFKPRLIDKILSLSLPDLAPGEQYRLQYFSHCRRFELRHLFLKSLIKNTFIIIVFQAIN